MFWSFSFNNFQKLFQGLFYMTSCKTLSYFFFFIFFFFSPSHLPKKGKVTFLSLHPSASFPLRSFCLTAVHSRRCQTEIILSVKLGNKARDTGFHLRTSTAWSSESQPQPLKTGEERAGTVE